MFSMTKCRGLDEVQTPFYFVNRRHYGEDVKVYQRNLLLYLVMVMKVVVVVVEGLH